MKKGFQIVLSLCLIGTATIIYLMQNNQAAMLDLEWVGFISGFAFALGIGSLVSMFFKKKSAGTGK